jgi:hypothetical protein
MTDAYPGQAFPGGAYPGQQPSEFAGTFPQAGGRVPVESGFAMKRRNPLASWIGLPLITFGIYGFVRYYKIHKEMAEFDRRQQVPVAGPVLVIIFLGWTVIAPLVSYYNCGKRIQAAQRAAGLPETCSAGLGCFLMLVLGIGVLYHQIELNKVVDAYGAVPPGSRVPLYV